MKLINHDFVPKICLPTEMAPLQIYRRVTSEHIVGGDADSSFGGVMIGELPAVHGTDYSFAASLDGIILNSSEAVLNLPLSYE